MQFLKLNFSCVRWSTVTTSWFSLVSLLINWRGNHRVSQSLFESYNPTLTFEVECEIQIHNPVILSVEYAEPSTCFRFHLNEAFTEVKYKIVTLLEMSSSLIFYACFFLDNMPELIQTRLKNVNFKTTKNRESPNSKKKKHYTFLSEIFLPGSCICSHKQPRFLSIHNFITPNDVKHFHSFFIIEIRIVL